MASRRINWIAKFEGFDYFSYPVSVATKIKKGSGGLEVFIGTYLKFGIKEWRHTDNVVAWFI